MSRRKRILFVLALVANFLGIIGCAVLFYLNYKTAGSFVFITTFASVTFTLDTVNNQIVDFIQALEDIMTKNI